jgi:microcystin-dependent protein
MVGDQKISYTALDHIGWMKCDGRLLSVSQYRLLFDIIGYTFGGSGNMFGLPNAIGRVPGIANADDGFLGKVDSSGNPLVLRAIGDTVGNEDHTLIIDEMPTHKHGPNDLSDNTNGSGTTTENGSHSHGGTTGSGGSAAESEDAQGASGIGTVTVSGSGSHTHTIAPDGAHTHYMGSTGGSKAHNNMQPTLFMGNMFIYSGRVRDGVFPYFAANNKLL